MDHEDIAKRCAESIMQRANDTYPRTLHKDMLVDEIGKAIREAVKAGQHWPPTLLAYEKFAMQQMEYLKSLSVPADLITARHEKTRARLDKHLSDYGKPE